MPNVNRNDPYGNFNFQVEIDGIAQAGFAEVVMPEASVQVIQYREGNERNTVRKLPGLVSYGNIILRWGCTRSTELYDWWKTVVEGHAERRNMSIILLDEGRNKAKRWNVGNAFPVRYHIGDLNAKGNGTLIEELEIAHEGFELDE
jgi:phage tail-like protein